MMAAMGGAPSTVAAGNDDGVLIGNEAAVSGGAVTAVINDGTALWYNPAGLALAGGTSVDVTATAFVLRWYRVPRFGIATTGESQDGSLLELVSIPSAVTLARPINDTMTIGFGAFVPQQNNAVVRTNLDASSMGTRSRLRLTVSEESRTYYVGAGVAWKLPERVRFGVSLFASYSQSFAFSQFWASQSTPTSETFSGESAVESLELGGLEARVGVQWEPLDGLMLGLSVESPDISVVEAYSIDSSAGVASSDGTDPVTFVPLDQSSLEFNASVVTPLRLRIGAAYAWDRGWVSFDADIQHGLTDQELGISRDFTWNLRVGGRVHLFDRFSAGAGLFTDRSASPEDSALGGLRADFYGLTLGVHFNRGYGLKDDEESDELVFSTSIGFRYAVGFGDVGGLLLDPTGAELVQVRDTDITIHEFGVHIGSALLL